jgi:hypothetical protein
LKPSLGIGVLLATLVSIVVFLFGLVGYDWLVALLLLLNGLWILVYGFVEAGSEDRLYYAGTGAVIAGLAGFVPFPPAYALGIVLVLVIVIIAIRLIAK